jgi:Transposase DDE domain
MAEGIAQACHGNEAQARRRRSRYRLRKQIVEPMLGQFKQARGFRQFLPRGLNKVRGEWAMVLYRPQPAQAGQSHRVIS